MALPMSDPSIAAAILKLGPNVRQRSRPSQFTRFMSQMSFCFLRHYVAKTAQLRNARNLLSFRQQNLLNTDLIYEMIALQINQVRPFYRS